MKKRAYIIDEEVIFSDVLASALRLEGYEAVQFFDAESALCYFKECGLSKSKDLFFIDMYLLPGRESEIFRILKPDDEYQIGLKLATVMVREGILEPRSNGNVVLYSAHNIRALWREIEKTATEYGMSKCRKRADGELDDFLKFISEG